MNNRILTYLLYFAIGFLFIGTLSRIMHWPGGKMTILLAKVAIGILYPYKHLHNPERTRRDSLKVLIVLIWVITGVLGFYATGPDRNPYRAISAAAIVGWLVLFFHEYMFGNAVNEKHSLVYKFSFAAFITMAFSLVAGSVLKIMHWPGGRVLLITGACTGVVWLYIELFKKEAH